MGGPDGSPDREADADYVGLCSTRSARGQYHRPPSYARRGCLSSGLFPSRVPLSASRGRFLSLTHSIPLFSHRQTNRQTDRHTHMHTRSRFGVARPLCRHPRLPSDRARPSPTPPRPLSPSPSPSPSRAPSSSSSPLTRVPHTAHSRARRNSTLAPLPASLPASRSSSRSIRRRPQRHRRRRRRRRRHRIAAPGWLVDLPTPLPTPLLIDRPTDRPTARPTDARTPGSLSFTALLCAARVSEARMLCYALLGSAASALLVGSRRGEAGRARDGGARGLWDVGAGSRIGSRIGSGSRFGAGYRLSHCLSLGSRNGFWHRLSYDTHRAAPRRAL